MKLPQAFRNLVDKSNRYLPYFKTFVDAPFENFQNVTIERRMWLMFNGQGIQSAEDKTWVLNEDLL